MANKNFHNILCPGCFSEFKPNNVVLALSKGPTFLDKYTRAQITTNVTRYVREYFDPVLFDGTKTYSEDGVLMKMENTEQGICADVRLCPYCHHEIPYAFVGTKKTHVISVLGCPGSGKSVYERALIGALRKNGFTMGVTNDNREIDTINPEDFTPPQDPGSKSYTRPTWSATTEIRGPYIYNAQNDQDDFLLIIYDLPGELFNTTRDIADNYVSSILKKSDLVVFIIDPTNSENSRTSLENYLNLLERESFAPNNLAILVNKVDDIRDGGIYNSFALCSRPHDEPGADSEVVKKLIGQFFFTPPAKLPANTKYFTSQLFVRNDEGWTWNPQRHEEPFLWWLQTSKSTEKKGKK